MTPKPEHGRHTSGEYARIILGQPMTTAGRSDAAKALSTEKSSIRRARNETMDLERLAKLSEEVFRLRQQLEAYSRLHEEEIEELRSRLRDAERRLSAVDAYGLRDATHDESADDGDSRPGPLPDS